MFRVVTNRCAAIVGIAAITAILAANLWCESACVSAQPDASVEEAASCHETQTAPLAITGHHECRDHQLESLTATTTPRVDVLHAAVALAPLSFTAADHGDMGAIRGAIARSSPPTPARAIAVLRI